MPDTTETVSTSTETTVEKRSFIKDVGGKALSTAKWLWSIPGIKSVIVTRLTQSGILGAVGTAIAVAIADKLAG